MPAHPRFDQIRHSWPLGLLCLAVASLLAVAGAVRPFPSTNDASRAAELIANVNALRASHGLAPYEVDPILMSVAAQQNDWRVSAGVTTHTGPDGSTPRMRAAAGGYGGGATIFISENIVDGTGLTPAEAVDWWTGDEPHLNTMLGPNYQQVGAGAGESGGVWRYTLMAGYVAGGPYSPGQASGSVSAPPGGAASAVVAATPRPDGSVLHVVEAGQTLWTIAAVYGVDLQTLLDLNGLTSDSLLHAGDQILVVPARTPTPSPQATHTVIATPGTAYALRATVHPVPSSTFPQPTPTAAELGPSAVPTLRPGSLVLVGLGAALILFGVLLGLRH